MDGDWGVGGMRLGGVMGGGAGWRGWRLRVMDGCDVDEGYDDDYAGGRGDLGEAEMRLTTGTTGEKCVCVWNETKWKERRAVTEAVECREISLSRDERRSTALFGGCNSW